MDTQSHSQSRRQTSMFVPIPQHGAQPQHSDNSQPSRFDPATYARTQQSHHAAVLTRVLAHNLSILPPLEPHASRSGSILSSSATSPTAFLASPVYHTGESNLRHPVIYDAPPGGDTTEVATWDCQSMVKDFGGLAAPYQYDPFASFPLPDQVYNPNQTYNPTQFVNPDWLHKANTPSLPIYQPQLVSNNFTSPRSPVKSPPSSPSSPNPFDGSCHILRTEEIPSTTNAPSLKKRKYTRHAVVEVVTGSDSDDDDDEDDDDEPALVEMNEHDLINSSLGRKDRRRIQNRLAQRAFRARSKISKREAASHLQDLEDQLRSQAGKMSDLTNLIDRLQKENMRLKSANWDVARDSGALGDYMTSMNAGLGMAMGMRRQ